VGWADSLSTKLLDILDPSLVLVETVGGETNDFHTTISKVFGATSNFAKLSGANRGKIICEQAPDKFMQILDSDEIYQDGRREWPVCMMKMGASVISRRSPPGYLLTHLSPIHSWNFIGPWVV
jgi:hypothetical protein